MHVSTSRFSNGNTVMILVALEITYLLAGDTLEFMGFQATAAALTCYTKPTIKAIGICICAGSYV